MSVGSSSLAAVDPSDPVSPAADSLRHGLFRYLTADESADYLAIMNLFSATLLVDLSAAEVTVQLAERAWAIDCDTVEARCRQLVAWGNLVPAVRDARVSTVAEYIRSRSRYQVSKLGGRLHREAVAILHASDGAREVARELLGQIGDRVEPPVRHGRGKQFFDERINRASALADPAGAELASE